MQIYPTVVGLYPTGNYGARNERANAAQKAEDRDRLLKVVQSTGFGDALEVNLLADQCVGSRYTEVPPGDEYHAPSEGKEFNFD